MTLDAEEVKTEVTVTFPCLGHIYEARTGRYFGKGRQAEVCLEAHSAPLFAVMRARAKRMRLAFDGRQAAARLEVSGGGRAAVGERVFRFDLLDARGKRLLDAGANVVAPAGAARWLPPIKVPAGGRLVCRDVATGTEAGVALRRKGTGTP